MGFVTSPERPPSVRPVEYKGEPLDGERGPGLGCFRIQAVVLVVLIILTPLSVAWGWPVEVSIAMLFVTLLLLLFAGQTIIFLLRLVASDRREGRRVPVAGRTPTVGQLEDETGSDVADEAGVEPAVASPVQSPAESDGSGAESPPESGVRE